MTNAAPDVKPDFTYLDTLDQSQLLQRRADLITKGNGNPADLGDTELEELVSIFSLLRRRSSGPPALKPAKAAKVSTKPSLDDLLGF